LLASSGQLQLNTAIDERSAAFLALGLATAGGSAVAVVTTSGTAVANLLPAVIEADRSCQPLLVITADRPIRLKACGANQTVNQEHFLRPACRWCGNGAPEGLHAMASPAVLELAALAWSQAQGADQAAAGPVHLNLPVEEPIHAPLQEHQPLLDAVLAREEASLFPRAAIVGPIQSRSPPIGSIAGRVSSLLAHGVAWPRIYPPISRPFALGWCAVDGLFWPIPCLLCPSTCQDDCTIGTYRLEQLISPESLQVLRLGPLPASRRLEVWLQRKRRRSSADHGG
jgi:2-succinyl-5-enolpyruvyl-6-hydroxy-3-cyclohexene-1-carboxylate synthase